MSKLLLVGEPLIRVSPNQFQPLTNACEAQLFSAVQKLILQEL